MRIALALGLAALATTMGACSGGANPASAEDDLTQDASADAAFDASTNADANTDAATAGPLPACLGDTLPIRISAGLPYVDAIVGKGFDAPTGAFLLDLATTGSTVDLRALSPRPNTANCDPNRDGEYCDFEDFVFFGSWGKVTLRTADHGGIHGDLTQAGILGTDFFAVHTYTIDYAGKTVRRAKQGALCTDSELVAAGFAPLTTAGFYSADLANLRPMTDVDRGASPTSRVPNVPTVPLRIGGARAVAQLDTGFDDGWIPHAINVNEAFFDAISAASPNALVRDRSLDAALTTCVANLSETVDAYRLNANATAEFLAVDGRAIRPRNDVVVFVKRTPAAAYRCGGIGTWTAPAAQVATSFFHDAGALVFDPFSARVWTR